MAVRPPARVRILRWGLTMAMNIGIANEQLDEQTRAI